VFARLKPDAALEQSAAAINSLYRGILSKFDAPLNTTLSDDQMRRFLELTQSTYVQNDDSRSISALSSRPWSFR
jgi:hypothetical protein